MAGDPSFGATATLALRALALRLQLGPMLRRNALPALLRKLSSSTTPSATAMPLHAVEKAVLMAERVASGLRVVPDTCLYRSLVRYAMFRGTGHAARFVMGVASNEPDIAGHAWVELDGRAYDEDIDPSVLVTFSYPEASAST